MSLQLRMFSRFLLGILRTQSCHYFRLVQVEGSPEVEEQNPFSTHTRFE